MKLSPFARKLLHFGDVVLDYVNGVDRASRKASALTAADVDAFHRTMVY